MPRGRGGRGHSQSTEVTQRPASKRRRVEDTSIEGSEKNQVCK